MTLVSRLAGAAAKLPPAATRQVTVERDLGVLMPDGVALLADHWFPATLRVGSAPTVLLRSPYGRRQLGVVGRLFAERGYQVLIQSCRGTFGSGGDWVPFRNEQVDGRATLEWVAAQSWFDGQLFTFGPSYLGLTQWAIAEDAPDFVRAMALSVTSSRFRDAVVYPGGVFALEAGIAWMHQLQHQEGGNLAVIRAIRDTGAVVKKACEVLPLCDSDTAAIGHPAGFFQDWLTHDLPGDTWWDPIDFGRQLAAVPPSTLVGGWYDLFLPAQLADYRALRAAGREVRLTVGPWTHASPRGMGEAVRDGLEWFDAHVGAVRSATASDDRANGHHRASPPAGVRLFVMGDDRWEEFAQWPPPADPQPWYLGRGRTLSPDADRGGSPDRYRYDPADPTPAVGGPALFAKSAGRKDQRPREARADVVTYTSPVLTEALRVVGPISARLYLRSTLDDTDFFVRLCDVSPKGRSINVSDGIVRLSPSNVTKDADWVFATTIDMWPTAHTFKVGHRIRLQVSSGAHPLFARNGGSGEALATATKLKVADQEIWHDADHPSSLVLPVLATSARARLQ
jgi:hypothetical protein